MIVVENPQETNAFVDHFEVEMLQPFNQKAVRLEYRSAPSTPIYQLAKNIPANGISDAVIVIALFDEHLPYESACAGRIAAIGPRDFSTRWQEFTCPPLT